MSKITIDDACNHFKDILNAQLSRIQTIQPVAEG